MSGIARLFVGAALQAYALSLARLPFWPKSPTPTVTHIVHFARRHPSARRFIVTR